MVVFVFKSGRKYSKNYALRTPKSIISPAHQFTKNSVTPTYLEPGMGVMTNLM